MTQSSRALLAAATVVLAEALCFTTVLPVISFYAQDLGGDSNWVAVMFVLMAGPKLLSNPLWGYLSDRWGRRPVLILNTLGTLAGSLTWALAPGVGWLALSRGLIGVFGGQATLAQAIVADAVPQERRSAGMGALGAAFALAMVIGPLLASWIVTVASSAAIGWVCAAFQVASLITICWLLPETRAAAEAAPQKGAVALPLGERRDLAIVLAATLIFTLAISQMNSTYGLVAEHHYSMDERSVGYGFALFGVVAAIAQGALVRPLAPRLGDRACALLGMLIAAIGQGLMAPAPGEAGFWIATVTMALGVALTTPCLTALVSRRVAAERQGAVLGLQQALIGVGRAAGAGLGGWSYRWTHPPGPAGPYGAAAVLIMLAMGVLALARAQRALPPRRPVPAAK